jgi:hypothetical protein
MMRFIVARVLPEKKDGSYEHSNAGVPYVNPRHAPVLVDPIEEFICIKLSEFYDSVTPYKIEKNDKYT